MAAPRILLIEEKPSDGAPTKRILETAGYEVHSTLVSDQATSTLVEGTWDVVICEWTAQTADFLERARNAQKLRTCLFIVASAKPLGPTITAALGAGADDYLARPVGKDELLARVKMQPRIAAKVNKQVAELITQRCWTSFRDSAHGCLGEMFGRDTELLAARPAVFVPHLASTITLSLPLKSVELRLVIQIERSCVEAIGAAVLGEDFAEGLGDIMSEVANTVGGAVMRVALEEQIEMTTSLPSLVDAAKVEASRGELDATSECWMRDTESGGFITVRLGIRARRNVVVSVNHLREGMVLARDLLSAAGALLLRAGTRMTSSSSARVATALGADFPVEVAEIA